jgi:alcohol dehydrogenase, propanol-preferring
VRSTLPTSLRFEQVEGSADAVISFAPSDAVTEQALRVLKWGGTLVMGVPVSVSGFPFNTVNVIKTSVLGNREQMRTVLQLAAEGKVRTVVDRFPMEQATKVLELLASGKMRSRGVLENFGASPSGIQRPNGSERR